MVRHSSREQRVTPAHDVPQGSSYYFFGEDTWAARRAIDALAHELQARLRFVERDELERDLTAAAAGTSLFGRVLPVVRDACDLPADIQRALAAGAAGCVFWDRGAPDRRSVLWRTFGSTAREFALPDMRTLAAWVREAARERGVALSAAAAAKLITIVGADRWQIEQELTKAAATGSVAPEPHGGGAEEDVFAVLAALAQGQSTLALTGVRRLLAAGHSEFYLLSMLAYQFRTLLIIRSGLDAGLQQFALVREGKVKSYSVQKNMPAARRAPAAFWLEALTRVLATDTAIRAGIVGARTGLLMLVGGLASATTASRSAAA